MNVALYGRSYRRWAMTERGATRLFRDANALVIGSSALTWRADHLTILINETANPVPRRIRGRIRVYPTVLNDEAINLDCDGIHRWRAVAPVARVEVTLERPALDWRGHAYFDSNHGAAPLEQAFTRWDWSRATQRDGTAVLYDVVPRHGEPRTLALKFRNDGGLYHFDAPPLSPLPRSAWRVARATRSDAGHASRVIETLEDTPFYARSLIAAQLLGEPVHALHESLSLERFSARWVQTLLPFRMPRAIR